MDVFRKQDKKPLSPNFLCRLCQSIKMRTFAHCLNPQCTWCLACYNERHVNVKPEGLK